MKEQLTPKQVAQALGVSEASIKRWCDKGIIRTTKTAGGHRRVAVASVLDYLKENRQELVRPEVLGLPPSTGTGERNVARAGRLMREALERGDEDALRAMAFNLFLGGVPTYDIFDRCFAEIFLEMGERWEHGALHIYQERRACEMSLRLLYELRMAILPVPSSAPLAIGGTLSNDPYALATTMAEITLRESGWRAQSLGVNLPAETLCSAIREERPSLFWLSVSHLTSEDAFVESYSTIYQVSSECAVPVVLGGRALTEDVRKRIRFTTYCDQMRHLVDFASAVFRES